VPLRHPGLDTKPYSNDHEHTEHHLRPRIPNTLRDLRAEEVRKPGVHPDKADTGDQRTQHKYVETHPENPRHESRHRHGRHEVIMSEGPVAFGKQFQAHFPEPSRVFEQPASLADTDLISSQRTEHPGDHSRGEHDAYVEPAFSRQRARRDQRRIA